MAANANVVSTKLISILTLGTRSVEQKLKEAAEKNLSSLKEDTDMPALQETPHLSESENRTHFTAIEINGNGNISAKRHFSVDQ
ncbi:hypothetical protein LOZ58_000070 [Ophidiomyces ophidiicola]|nr:hypothetical protein LOZ58_000070 [Ophidiomyces ophidiicola]